MGMPFEHQLCDFDEHLILVNHNPKYWIEISWRPMNLAHLNNQKLVKVQIILGGRICQEYRMTQQQWQQLLQQTEVAGEARRESP